MKLELSKIKIGNGLQSRVEIDQKTVTEYTEILMNGGKFPPVTVFHDGVNYYLVDGYHRYFAHKNAVWKEINVDVIEGTLRDAFKYSLGVNDKHGLKRSNEDKRNAVMKALDDLEISMLSSREIATICNVSHAYVQNIKDKLNEEKKPAKAKVVEPKIPGESKSDEAEVEDDYEEDKIAELLVVQKDLEEENNKLKDKLAVGSMSGTEADKKLAYETIEELRQEVARLEGELDAMTISRNSYMRENAEMKKQLVYYRNKLKKLEPQE